MEGVKSAEVSLVTRSAIVESPVQVGLEKLQAVVGAVGNYNITAAIDACMACPLPTNPPEAKSWLQTYQPLLTIAAFIVGGTLLIATSSGNWHVMALMNSFMGLFFVVFSFFKLLDVPGFARAYSSYDIVAARWPGYGFIYPWIELTLGVAYLLACSPIVTNLLTLAIMTVGTIGVVKAVLKRQEIQCGCLGTVFQLPMSSVTIIEDVLMAGMAASMLVMLS